MRREKSVDDLSVDELRYRLIEAKRQRLRRRERLGNFRVTGQVASILSGHTRLDQEVLSTLEKIRSRTIPPPKQSSRHLQLDRFLLAVEIIAVLGLLYVVYTGFNLIGELNHEVASAIAQPTSTPRPLIHEVVLPAGHTPPDAPSGVQPNLAEVPEQLRTLAPALPTVPVPTPAQTQATRIQIAAIGVDAPIVQGDGWEQLKQGVAQHPGTPDPGQPGNLVLSAHNDVFGEIFRNLDRLSPGDEIILYSQDRQVTYRVNGTEIVPPTKIGVLAPTENATLTLISCYPYLVDTQRIVVKAEFVEK